LLKDPVLPFSFEPGSSSYETDHLEYRKASGHVTIAWPLLGLEVIVPVDQQYYDVIELEKLNGGVFKDWDRRGYSLGSYHEFFCLPLDAHAAFKASNIEVTFGYATPLAACLYHNYHDKHYFDPWDSLTTARILGTSRELAEAVFINAAIGYQKQFNVLPQLMRLEVADDFDGETEDDQKDHIVALPPAVLDVEPLRFHYNGLAQVDPVAACIYFYRVIEHFSFLSHQKEISKIRHDPTLSDNDFAKRILEIAFKDEKGPVLRLVSMLADTNILGSAVKANLVKSADASYLGGELYAFRNSIVHGKVAAGYVPETASVLSVNPKAFAWREILRLLSERSMQTFGRKYL